MQALDGLGGMNGYVKRWQAFSVAIALAGALLAFDAAALPRMALTAGSRCINCHVNPQGSGMRGDLGWYSMNQVGTWTWDKVGLSSLHNIESNAWLDGKLLFGFDYRGQSAQFGAPGFVRSGPDKGKVKDIERIYIPMQLSPAIAVVPTPTLTVTGSVNLLSVPVETGAVQKAKEKVAEAKANGTTPSFSDDALGHFRKYPGQSHYEAWARWQGDFTWPAVRVGMMQPSFGVRHDDHTLLLRRNAASLKTPVVPPFYNDPGVEVSYSKGFEGEAVHNEIAVDIGGFVARNFVETETPRFNAKAFEAFTAGKKDLAAINAEAMNTPMVSARVTLHTQMLESGVTGWLMGSLWHVGDVQMHDVSLAVGKSYWGSLIGEWTHNVAPKRTMSNWLAMASWAAAESLSVNARYERATTNDETLGSKEFSADSVVVGVEWFPLPFIELRPEYRYLVASDESAPDPSVADGKYAFGQYTFQMHLFF
jgi:hypothetical protein